VAGTHVGRTHSRMRLVWFGMQNRTFGSYLAAISAAITEINGMQLVPIGMQKTFGPYSAAINKMLVSATGVLRPRPLLKLLKP
jgi:hypothetical protein